MDSMAFGSHAVAFISRLLPPPPLLSSKAPSDPWKGPLCGHRCWLRPGHLSREALGVHLGADLGSGHGFQALILGVDLVDGEAFKLASQPLIGLGGGLLLLARGT
jgi:hypothetical protein